jgi:hypothetical protein
MDSMITGIVFETIFTTQPHIKTLTIHQNSVKYKAQAEVAELADALRSGRSGIILMRVQIPPSALNPVIKRGFFFGN